MTPNQLPPLPEPDTHCFDDDTGKDVWSYTADQMHAYALAALSQPAPSPQPAVPVVSDEQVRKTVESIQDPDTVHAFHNGYYTLTPDELRRAILALRPSVAPMTDGVFDLICGAIDKADTVTMEGDYMMDSDDCIAVVRVMQALLSVHGIPAKAERGA